MPSLRQLLSQLDPDQLKALGGAQDTPNPQVLTPQNQQAITRPRTVSQLPPQAVASIRDMMARQSQQPIPQPDTAINTTSPSMRQMQQPMNLPDETPFGSGGEPFRIARPRRVEQRDTVADDDAYLRDVESGVKHDGWKAKTLQVLDNLNQQFNDKPRGRTLREMQIAQAQGMLGRDMAVEKSRTASELSSLTPVQLEDGSVVMAPRRSAGTLASQQQNVRRQNDTLTARKDRWKQMGQHEAVQDALRVYNSGGANDPETLQAISDTLDLPATLKPKFMSGEVVPQVDNNGDIQLINKRDGSVVDTGVKTYETTKEAGRNARQERAATAAMARTQALIAAGIGKLGDPDVTEKAADDLQDQIDDAKEAAEKATADGFPSQATQHLKRADDLQKTKTSLEEAANKARAARNTVAPSGTTKGKLSRATFIKNNPKATAGKSSQEVDAMISGGGYQPIP